MNKIIEINDDNIIILEKFIEDNIFPITFRYFSKRSIDCVKNHLITLIFQYNNIPIGYAHIDFDGNKYWFGICILENYQSKGYGKMMMNYLFNHEKIKNIEDIYLTVDKINQKAIELYKKYNFVIIEEFEYYFLMKKII